MSAALGVGVRVYVGYTPDHRVAPNTDVGTRCSTGTIIAGPYPPGSLFVPSPDPTRHGGLNPETWWIVRMDKGSECYASERLLTPIDDDGESETRKTEEEVTA